MFVASRWYVPAALVPERNKQTGNGRVRLFATLHRPMPRQDTRCCADAVGTCEDNMWTRGICSTHHLLTMRESICACALVLTEGICTHSVQEHIWMVNCWAVGARCRGHVQGADGCPFAHHGYLLAPPMF